MPLIIDAHQDLAYNMLTFGRDYRRSAAETRQIEQDTRTPSINGHTLLGWPDYQKGQVAVIFSTIFIIPERFKSGNFENQVYQDFDQADQLYRAQLNQYRGLADDSPDNFRLIYTTTDLAEVLDAWEETPVDYPKTTHPVGLILSMEGAEGLRDPSELEEWWGMGLRIVGPVWAGTRYCGGMYTSGDFTSEGFALLEMMAELGYTLDVTHMSEVSARRALDVYDGPVIASHANVRSLLKSNGMERHLSNPIIQQMVERDGIIGVIPFNRFLRPGWSSGDDPQAVTLETLAAHIDAICQIAGDARHVGLGTDFDGGFGWPSVPAEVNTIADLQKLGPILASHGYTPEDIDSILGGNWLRHLERTLP